MGFYLYSAVNNAFYPKAMKSVYVKNNSWPTDGILVKDSIYNEFATNSPPSGKQRIAGDDGMPAWGDIAPPAADEIEKLNRRKLSKLIKAAVVKIAILQATMTFSRNNEAEVDVLLSWQRYLCDLHNMSKSELQHSSVLFPTEPKTISAPDSGIN